MSENGHTNRRVSERREGERRGPTRPHRAVSIGLGFVTFAVGAAFYTWAPGFLERIGALAWVFTPAWGWLWYLLAVGVWMAVMLLAIALEPAVRGRVPLLKAQKAREVDTPSGVQHEHPLWGMFTALWGAWAATVIIVEFFLPSAALRFGATVPPSGQLVDRTMVANLWMALFLAFVAIEGMGVIQSRAGDTLSEQVWAFIHGEVTRAGVALGLVFMLIVRVVELAIQTEPTTTFGFNTGRLLLGAGVATWLVFHFVVRELQRMRP